MSLERKQVPSGWNISCSVQGDMCRTTTIKKIPPWVKVLDRKGKNVARLAFNELFEGTIE